MTGNKITFWSFIQKNKIEIPIIQRDYAQGRLGKEYLRQGFITNQKEAIDEEDYEKEIKLYFVYGSVEKGKHQPFPTRRSSDLMKAILVLSFVQMARILVDALK